VLLYAGRDEEKQSNKWRFIELSMAYTPLISDRVFTIPDGEWKNRNKYILVHIRNLFHSMQRNVEEPLIRKILNIFKTNIINSKNSVCILLLQH
jgi:hypothetical protein